jgi:hypothetical protein
MVCPQPTPIGTPLAARLSAVIAVLASRRFRLSSEYVLQADIEASLSASGLTFKREHRLSAQDRVDFFGQVDCHGIAIEVKIAGGKHEIYRQCKRYCEHSAVTALVLVTNVAMALPQVIEGKPTAVVMPGRAWL